MAGAGMTAVDSMVILYLALPVALFFFTWFRPVFGIPFGLAALAGVVTLLPLPDAKQCWRVIGLSLVVAVLWGALSGASHFFYAGNETNWPIRDAVYRDLIVTPGAVEYREQNGFATILRAPIAYYMVPALVARFAGIQFAPYLHYAWTTIGLMLFLLQVMPETPRWKPAILTAAVVVLFGGMDILSPPDMITSPSGGPTWHATFYQSTFTTALLIFSPNHGVPGWLATALIYRCGRDIRFVRVSAWLGSLTLLWAPLVSIGLLPFFLLMAFRSFRIGHWRSLFSPYNLVAAPLIALPAALYVTVAAGTIVTNGPAPPGWLEYTVIYLPFMLVEFGVLALALLCVCRDGIDRNLLAVAVVSLLALPWFHFGPNNDLIARGSIPALTVIMLTVIDGWARPATLAGRRAVVTVMLAIGAIMPVITIYQVLGMPTVRRPLDRSLYETTGGAAPNYLADIQLGSRLGQMLRLSPSATSSP